MERSKYFVLHGTKVWIDKRVSKQYFIFWSITPSIRASKQNHITTVIYWNTLDSCVKTERTIKYLEYFMLSCSTLLFLLRNSTDAQLWRPSVVKCLKWAGRDVTISQRSKCEGQNNRDSPASLHAGKLQQEERVSYAWAEPQYPPQGQQRRGGCWQELNLIFSLHTPFPGALSSGLDYFCAARANTFRSCQRIHSKSRVQARLSSFHKNPVSNVRFLTLTHTVTSKNI